VHIPYAIRYVDGPGYDIKKKLLQDVGGAPQYQQEADNEPSPYVAANFILTHNHPHFIFCPSQSEFPSII
jgi:hypothetical protein